ncbi:MAG: enoyl-CoA hydratase/isomerase family protein, partial [Hyphomicrobiales bacterium]
GEVGMYLALTGARLKAAECLYAGLATHYVPSGRLKALEEALVSSDDVEEALKGFSADAGEAGLGDVRGDIDQHFAGAGVEEILESLVADGSEWAAKQVGAIRSKSPTSQKIAYRQLREGAKARFEECMKIEWRMVNRIYTGHDFYEGIRAVVIDKDNEPRWQPADLQSVGEADVAAYFAMLEDELAV